MTAPTNGTPWLGCVNGAKIARRVPNSIELSTEFVSVEGFRALMFGVEKNVVEVKSSECARIGQIEFLLSRVTTTTVSFAIARKNVEAFRAAFSGKTTVLDRASTPVTAQAIDFKGAGVWIEYATHKTSAFTIAGSTPGTDYEVDYASALVKALPNGNLIDVSTTCDYNLDAEVGVQQDIGNLSQVEWALKIPINDQYEESADSVVCVIDATTVDTSGEVKATLENPEDQDESVLIFTVKMRTLPGQTAPARMLGMPGLIHDWV